MQDPPHKPNRLRLFLRARCPTFFRPTPLFIFFYPLLSFFSPYPTTLPPPALSLSRKCEREGLLLRVEIAFVEGQLRRSSGDFFSSRRVAVLSFFAANLISNSLLFFLKIISFRLILYT
jgi:hypothetical protein